jgi:hypothetical protein
MHQHRANHCCTVRCASEVWLRALCRKISSISFTIPGATISGVGSLGGKVVKTLDSQLRAQMSGGVDHLKAKLAFYPPPPTYFLETEPRLGALQMWILDKERPDEGSLVMATGFTVTWLHTSSGSQIPAYIFEVPQPRFTILYSHSNGTDIGHMCELCRSPPTDDPTLYICSPSPATNPPPHRAALWSPLFRSASQATFSRAPRQCHGVRVHRLRLLRGAPPSWPYTGWQPNFCAFEG